MNSYKSRELFPAYRLEEKKFIKEVNAHCYLLEHIKSGARILKIASDDTNKTFSIAFRTIPESDEGTPHIIEHSVLNGSKNFPVRSPFDILLKGSLNTFINAFTSNDWTAYPVASMNENDYFNLMHVYLDAVFNPLIYSDQRIFMQEGWHYELSATNAPLEYKGVVYNEMRGAYSDPETILYSEIMKNIFPDNCYRFSSGGFPPEITRLTYNDFLNFHKKYYHPSNSYIFLYGDADLRKELDFIDKEYLSKYQKSNIDINLKENLPFKARRVSHIHYPVIEDTPKDNLTFLSLSWVIGSGTDDLTILVLDVLADILINQESAPVRVALQEAGIGKEVYATKERLLQNVFTLTVRNANPDDSQKLINVLYETLHKVCSDKVDNESLKGTLNRIEFSLREGNHPQKGILYNLRCINNWMYTGNPFPSLEYENFLDQLKQLTERSFIEDFIRRYLVENNHMALVVLEPESGLEKESIKNHKEELEQFKKTLTSQQIDSIIDITRKLTEFQRSEDSPEALATIPLLKLTDINSEARWYACSENEIGSIKHLHHNEFTNNIIYSTFWFDMRVLPQQLIPYAALVTELLGKIGTEKYDFRQLEKALNINTGGFSSYIGIQLPDFDDNKAIPMLTVKLKATADKIDTSLRLTGEILRTTDFSDIRRLKDLLNRIQANLETSLNQEGFNPSHKRFESYISKRGMIVEITSNIEYYRFVTELVKQYNEDPDTVTAKLKNVAKLLFSGSNLIAGVTCDEQNIKIYKSSFMAFIADFPSRVKQITEWDMVPVVKNEGIMTSSKVQYVIKGYDFRKLGLEWNGKWKVLNQIISTDWLQTQVRVVGGAYGGFSRISRDGSVLLASYRDPNLAGTLESFDKTVGYLSKFKAESNVMTRFIIGTIAELDYLTTPSQRGDISFGYYFGNITPEFLQKERNEVLSTNSQDIREMSQFIDEILKQNVLCAYGNDEVIKMNKKLFKNLITIDK